MAAIDLDTRLRDIVAGAINDASLGEDFPFTIIPIVQMTPAGPVITYQCAIFLRNPVLRQPPFIAPFTVSLLAAFGPAEKAVRDQVHKSMGDLRALQRKALAANN